LFARTLRRVPWGAVTSAVEFVEAAFPLVLVRLPSNMGAPELRVMFEGFERVHARRLPYFVVMDTLSVFRLPNPVERKMITDWLRGPARTALVLEYNLGSAIAVGSFAVRAIVTALTWIRRPPTPQAVVGTVVEAIDIGLARLRERGIDVTPAMDRLRAQERVRARPLRR
jgi:hypothetical protein